MRSLRGRLTAGLLAGLGLLLAAGGLLLNRFLGAQLLHNYDSALTARVRSLATLAEQEDGRVWLEFSDEVMPEFDRKTDPDYFQLWLRDGPVIERSRSLGIRNLPRSGAPLDQTRLRDLTLPDGRHGRLAEVTFRPRSETLELAEERGETISGSNAGNLAATVAVAQSREELDALLASLRVALTLVVLGLLGGAALLVKAVVGFALAPLDSLARQLEVMDADSLGSQAPDAAGAPAELRPVIHHLNGLLARLDESFARERSFSANLAHELRTPLSELRAVTDVALKWPEDTGSHLEAITEVRGIGLQMERVVVNLLALARFDGRQHTVWPSEVSLGELAASCWSAVASEAGEKGMTLRLEIPDGLAVVTDREKLGLILANLFSNAVAHGSPGNAGGGVTCSGSRDGESFVLRIGNPAGSLTPEDLPRIFDRFWRKDPARSGGRHAGLGLSLVSALCDLLGFEKEARLAGGWFEITLRGRAAAAEPDGGGSDLVGSVFTVSSSGRS